MQVGIHFVNFNLPGAPASLPSTLAETAQIAEEGGASTFTVMDHWFQMEAFANAADPMSEGHTTLGSSPGRTGHPPPAKCVSPPGRPPPADGRQVAEDVGAGRACRAGFWWVIR